MKLTGSRLPIASRCLGAVVLPGVHTESSDAAAAGTGRHTYLRRVAEVGRDAALAEIPADAPWRSTCEGIAVEEIPTGLWEPAYAYHPETDTARLLGTDTGRDYSGATEDEITGTADLVDHTPGDARPWVIDFKGSDAVDPPAVNLQLGFYALCVARVWGADSARVSICYVHSDGRLEWHHADLDGWDLDAVASRVKSIWSQARELRAAGQTPDLVAGLHCRYCHAFTVCPAMVTMVQALDRTFGDLPPGEAACRTAMLSDEEAGRAWVRVQLLDELLAAMRASLRQRAEMRGLPLPDGSTLIAQESVRRAVDVDRALPVLRARFGEQADGAVERSISIAVVERLARQIAPGKGQKKAVEDLVNELRAAGAVRESKYVQLRVKKPRAQGGEES